MARPYDVTNANDDHGRPGREDYSILLLAPDSISLDAVQPAWSGPWATRTQGNTASADAAWAARVTGEGTTASAAWAARQQSTTTSENSAWAGRCVGVTQTTENSTYTVRIDGQTSTT